MIKVMISGEITTEPGSMKAEDKLYEDWQYACKPCRLIYHVYGSSLRCDICNRKLKLIPPGEVTKMELK